MPSKKITYIFMKFVASCLVDLIMASYEGKGVSQDAKDRVIYDYGGLLLNIRMDTDE